MQQKKDVNIDKTSQENNTKFVVKTILIFKILRYFSLNFLSFKLSLQARRYNYVPLFLVSMSDVWWEETGVQGQDDDGHDTPDTHHYTHQLHHPAT